MGQDPAPIAERMLSRGFVSAHYAYGSYKFHRNGDYEGAKTELKKVIEAKKFRFRTVRLLARIQLKDNDPEGALATLNRLRDAEIERDSGLIAMKIKALRGLREFREATRLEAKLRTMGDDYGEVLIFEASSEIRKKNFPAALAAVEKALDKPKTNRAPLMFMKCTIELMQGESKSLAEACALAEATGRFDDSHELKARAAISLDRDWRRAESELSLIKRHSWFTWELELKILELKSEDNSIARDVREKRLLGERKEEALRRLATSVDIQF